MIFSNIDKTNKFLSILYLFIWPFGAFIKGVRSFWTGKGYIYIVFFYTFIGFSLLPTGDAARYSDSFEIVSNYTFENYLNIANANLFQGESHNLLPNAVNKKADIFALTLQFIISKLTENVNIFFALIAFLYAFITFKVLSFIEVLNIVKFNKNQKILILMFLCAIPFTWPIVGVRFWLAIMLFLWFALKFYKTGGYLYIFALLGCTLIHYTVIIMVVLFGINFITFRYKLPRVLIIFMVLVVLLLSQTSILLYIDAFITGSDIGIVKSSSSSYTNSEYVTAKNSIVQKSSIHAIYWKFSLKVALSFLTFLEVIGVLTKKNNFADKNFYRKLTSIEYILFFYVLLTWNLQSIGRFAYLYFLIFFIRRILIYSKLNHKVIRKELQILKPIMFIYVLISLRVLFYSINPFIFISNPFVAGVFETTQSISDFIFTNKE